MLQCNYIPFFIDQLHKPVETSVKLLSFLCVNDLYRDLYQDFVPYPSQPHILFISDPFDTDFENGWSHWKQNFAFNLMWEIANGSISRYSGPDFDHTNGNGKQEVETNYHYNISKVKHSNLL